MTVADMTITVTSLTTADTITTVANRMHFDYYSLVRIVSPTQGYFS